jgi:LysM domain-containing protein
MTRKSMTGARLSRTTGPQAVLRMAPARPVPLRPGPGAALPGARRPLPGRPATAPGGRPAAAPGTGRYGGSAGARPVRGGAALPCPATCRQAVRRGAAPGAPVLRLTRRGRRLLAALLVVIGLGIAALTVGIVRDGAGTGLQLAGRTSVVVEPGDSLWSIASEAAPERDTRAVVDAIEDANDLGSTVLVPGMVLRLP